LTANALGDGVSTRLSIRAAVVPTATDAVGVDVQNGLMLLMAVPLPLFLPLPLPLTLPLQLHQLPPLLLLLSSQVM